MAEPIAIARSVRFTYHDYDHVNGDLNEELEVVIEELENGSIRMKLDNEPAYCSLEFMSQWAYTLNNWKNRIKKDIVKLGDDD